MPLISFR
jgi:hypothetical protein